MEKAKPLAPVYNIGDENETYDTVAPEEKRYEWMMANKTAGEDSSLTSGSRKRETEQDETTKRLSRQAIVYATSHLERDSFSVSEYATACVMSFHEEYEKREPEQGSHRAGRCPPALVGLSYTAAASLVGQTSHAIHDAAAQLDDKNHARLITFAADQAITGSSKRPDNNPGSHDKCNEQIRQLSDDNVKLEKRITKCSAERQQLADELMEAINKNTLLEQKLADVHLYDKDDDMLTFDKSHFRANLEVLSRQELEEVDTIVKEILSTREKTTASRNAPVTATPSPPVVQQPHTNEKDVTEEVTATRLSFDDLQTLFFRREQETKSRATGSVQQDDDYFNEQDLDNMTDTFENVNDESHDSFFQNETLDADETTAARNKTAIPAVTISAASPRIASPPVPPVDKTKLRVSKGAGSDASDGSSRTAMSVSRKVEPTIDTMPDDVPHGPTLIPDDRLTGMPCRQLMKELYGRHCYDNMIPPAESPRSRRLQWSGRRQCGRRAVRVRKEATGRRRL